MHWPPLTKPVEHDRQLVEVPGAWQVRQEGSHVLQVFVEVSPQVPAGHVPRQLLPDKKVPVLQVRHVVAVVTQVLQTELQAGQVDPDK